ncbi:hypothetical protein CO154_00075 [Candidatus Pacearchaeota archaeon CG_4_9_14_3_um_filter_31_7]|nr:MAG: hypothetical protein AUJ10_00510 [Candidatus Pacearchaeota archaeon CG1_02_31_27]PIN92301.1 MAG: hypothetical protein COU55_00615 [Candidatus Pacearchaeota archaeon CG10_big_fil_rev_8_21_14_0_10_31_59]PIZ81150.1 MAG: hypothetical protein COX99_00575 [Candidatus Pacearchaeota archaeon CG_4_10_14_0_2_um_filter_31_10]PJA70972.1 MAG: hypothetical protein CO154_00075 [Candidatus Pacearchaeota archaeon CG_4_9_14_3_um_filter_31_7]
MKIWPFQTPAQKARKTSIIRYGLKGKSPQGLKKISNANRIPVTKPFFENKRLGISYKSKKTAPSETIFSLGSKMDVEVCKRRNLGRGNYLEGGISSLKGIYSKIGNKNRSVKISGDLKRKKYRLNLE